MSDKLITDFNLEKRYSLEPLDEIDQYKLHQLMDIGLKVSRQIVELVPDSRERQLAIERMQEAIQWAITGITEV